MQTPVHPRHAPVLLRPPKSVADTWTLHLVRVIGHLEADAQLAYTTGAEPRALLRMTIKPPHGLPYLVVQDLGTDPADHMNAQATVLALRRGALVSATGESLRLQHDHGHAQLALQGCRAVVPLVTHPDDQAVLDAAQEHQA